jgi:hypothetical protein
MDLLREAVDVATKTARSPLATCGPRQTDISLSGIGGFDNQFDSDFDFSSFQSENENAGSSNNISLQISSTANMPPHLQGEAQHSAAKQGNQAGQHSPGKRNIIENEFESGQHSHEMFECLGTGMQSNDVVNPMASSHFDSELPFTTWDDSLAPLPDLDFYSLEPEFMLFDIEQQGFDGNWQFANDPLGNTRFY